MLMALIIILRVSARAWARTCQSLPNCLWKEKRKRVIDKWFGEKEEAPVAVCPSLSPLHCFSPFLSLTVDLSYSNATFHFLMFESKQNAVQLRRCSFLACVTLSCVGSWHSVPSNGLLLWQVMQHIRRKLFHFVAGVLSVCTAFTSHILDRSHSWSHMPLKTTRQSKTWMLQNP